MPVSPKKNVSHVTSSAVNKGVQAREVDIVNVRLDTDALSISQAATESSEWPADTWGYRAGVGEVLGKREGAIAAGDAPNAPAALTPPLTDQSVSCVQQVVVQKQRRSGTRGLTASSPMRAELGHTTLPIAALESSAVPAAVLLACPAFAALHQQPSWDKTRGLLQAGSHGMQGASSDARSSEDQDTVRQRDINNEKVKHQYFWKQVHCSYKRDADDYDDGPDCMEVYEFDHGCETLVARGSGPVSYIERGARRASRPAAALLSEVLAVARLAVAVPVHIALQLQRCLLLGVRDAATGVVQTTVDALLKPLLALAFNAVLRPPLVCMSHSAQALREVLHPLALAMSDALDPLAKLLTAIRFVQINRQCTCAHHV